MFRTNPSPPGLALLLFGATAVFALAACGGSGEDTAGEVATLASEQSDLGDAADAATRDDGTGSADLAPDEAALEFSQCMRDAGLDFPDLSVDSEGNIELRDAFQTVDRQADGFQEAFTGCGEILQQTGFGGGRRASLESTEVQDGLLDFSQCVRDEGFDVGDLTLDGPGQPPGDGDNSGNDNGGAEGQAAGDGQGAGQGQQGDRQQGFGNRNGRFADNLGLDYEDPEVQETIDGCMPIIDEAFSAAGVGQPPAEG